MNKNFRLYGTIGYWPCDSETFSSVTRELKSGDSLRLLINSPGGYYSEGLAISSEVHELKKRGVEVSATVMAECSSAATLPLLAVDKANRTAYSGAIFLFHRPGSAASGFAEDLDLESNSLKGMTTEVERIMASSLSISRYDAAKMLERVGTWMTSAEMLEKGFIAALAEPEVEIPESVTTNKSSSYSSVMMMNSAKKKEEKTMEKEKAMESTAQGEDLFEKGRLAEVARRKAIADLCPEGYEKEMNAALNDIAITPEKFAMSVIRKEKEMRAASKKMMFAEKDDPVIEPSGGTEGGADDEEVLKRVYGERWSRSQMLRSSFKGKEGKEQYVSMMIAKGAK